MNTKTLMTIKMEKSLKLAAQETAAKIGIPLGTLVNAYLKQFVREKTVTFRSEYVPNRKTRMAIAEGMKEYRKGKLKPMTLKELRADLEA